MPTDEVNGGPEYPADGGKLTAGAAIATDEVNGGPEYPADGGELAAGTAIATDEANGGPAYGVESGLTFSAGIGLASEGCPSGIGIGDELGELVRVGGPAYGPLAPLGARVGDPVFGPLASPGV